MTVPGEVNVLGLHYKVVVRDLDGEDGVCVPSRQRIEIDSGLSGEKMTQVFLHELVHAIFDQLSCMDEYEDERLVQGLAVGLYQALFESTSSSS